MVSQMSQILRKSLIAGLAATATAACLLTVAAAAADEVRAAPSIAAAAQPVISPAVTGVAG